MLFSNLLFIIVHLATLTLFRGRLPLPDWSLQGLMTTEIVKFNMYKNCWLQVYHCQFLLAWIKIYFLYLYSSIFRVTLGSQDPEKVQVQEILIFCYSFVIANVELVEINTYFITFIQFNFQGHFRVSAPGKESDSKATKFLTSDSSLPMWN
jgi:hypothetical protein